MCQIAVSKSTEKVKKNYHSDCSDGSDSSEKNHATSAQKITQLLHKKSRNLSFFFFLLFLLLLERAIWHTWQLMWCSQGSVLRFLLCFPYEGGKHMLQVFLLGIFFFQHWHICLDFRRYLKKTRPRLHLYVLKQPNGSKYQRKNMDTL